MQTPGYRQSYCEALIRLLFPAHCGLCEQSLTLQEQTLCLNCARELKHLKKAPYACPLLDTYAPVDQIWGLFDYTGPVRDLLQKIKFEREKWVLNSFRDHLEFFGAALAAEKPYAAALSIPMTRGKRLERGFNQSEEIARMLFGKTNLRLPQNLLLRKHSLPSQSWLKREERLANVYGAFKIKRPQDVTGKHFLLVDDIFTTGATAMEAARTLKEFGAKSVDLVALALAHSGAHEKQAA